MAPPAVAHPSPATAVNAANAVNAVHDGRLAWLQVARAVAALLVLMFHLRPLIAGAPLLAPSAAWWNYGLCGVDIFFVISGFVVARSLQALPVTNGAGLHFLARRFVRIFSGYWPALAVMVLVTMRLPGQEKFPPMQHLWDSLFLLSPSLFDHWLGTAWSLSYELYFYLWLWALFFVVRSGTFYQRLVGAMALLAVVNGAWYVLAPDLVENGEQPLRQVFAGFGIEFLAGACIAQVLGGHAGSGRTAVLPLRLVPLFVLFGLLGLLIGSASYHFANVEVLRAVSFGLCGLGVVLTALTLDSHRRAAPRWLVRLGDSSFSLYLLHPLLISLFGWAQFVLVPQGLVVGTLLTLSAPFVIVAACHGWYLAVERPVLKLAQRALETCWKRPARAGAGSAIPGR